MATIASTGSESQLILKANIKNLSIDSFQLLWNQIENDVQSLFSDIRDVFALIGAFYVARKSLKILSFGIEAINVHVLSQLSYDSDDWWTRQYGPWAVVTGSSEGIGFAYANELAKRGLNVVLISRNKDKLQKAKIEIESETKVKVECIAADFGSESQSEVYMNISEQLVGKEIGLLVNNVGVMYDYPDVMLNIPSYKLSQIISVNVGAATLMSHMLLPQMIKRGRGGLVVVSSASATHISPQMTVYAATKKYLDYFIEGLSYEYRNSGVTFQCLVPSYVSTSMIDYSYLLSKSNWFVPDARQFAKSAVRSLGRSNRTAGHFSHTLQLWCAYLMPEFLWRWIIIKVCNYQRRQAKSRNSTLTQAALAST